MIGRAIGVALTGLAGLAIGTGPGQAGPRGYDVDIFLAGTPRTHLERSAEPVQAAPPPVSGAAHARPESGAHRPEDVPAPAYGVANPPQRPATEPVVYNPDYLLNYPLNLLRIAVRPFSLDPDQALANGLVALGTLALIFADRPVRDFVQQSLRGGFTDFLSDVASPMGDNKVGFGGLFGAYLAGEVASDRRLKEVGLLGVQAVAISQLAVGGLKSATGRLRPNATDNVDDFGGPGTRDGNSFPSGHATNAFAIATIIDGVYDDWRLSSIAYGFAGLTAFARVNDNKHWLSDVFFASALGYAVGRIVVVTSPFRADTLVAVVPAIGEDGAGARLLMRF